MFDKTINFCKSVSKNLRKDCNKHDPVSGKISANKAGFFCKCTYPQSAADCSKANGQIKKRYDKQRDFFKKVLKKWWTMGTLLVMFILIINLLTFENAADMKFIFGINLPWKIWKRLYSNSSTLGDFPTNLLIKNCSEIDAIYSSYHPILFKQCIDQDLTIDDFIFFQENVQNVFPLCKEKLFRNFQFESSDGETKEIIEDVPCANSTLAEKVANFKLHELSEDESNSYFEVHTHMMKQEEKLQLEDDLSNKLLIVKKDLGLTSKMISPVLTYFLHAGRSAVYYLHAHMDHFLSFCLSEKKTWILINPLYLDDFESDWSGNARIMLKEKLKVPKIIVHQEKGDILFIPPWWIHETLVRKMKKNIGFNLHFGVRGQVLFEVVNIVHRFLGDASFFYNKVIQMEPDNCEI